MWIGGHSTYKITYVGIDGAHRGLENYYKTVFRKEEKVRASGAFISLPCRIYRRLVWASYFIIKSAYDGKLKVN